MSEISDVVTLSDDCCGVTTTICFVWTVATTFHTVAGIKRGIMIAANRKTFPIQRVSTRFPVMDVAQPVRRIRPVDRSVPVLVANVLRRVPSVPIPVPVTHRPVATTNVEKIRRDSVVVFATLRRNVSLDYNNASRCHPPVFRPAAPAATDVFVNPACVPNTPPVVPNSGMCFVQQLVNWSVVTTAPHVPKTPRVVGMPAARCVVKTAEPVKPHRYVTKTNVANRTAKENCVAVMVAGGNVVVAG